MYKLIILVASILFCSGAFASCNDFGGKEKKECNKSKQEERECKGIIKKEFIKMDKKNAGKLIAECIKELSSFCKDKALYKGCKIDASSRSCTIWKMNKTRTDSEDKKSFPKDMDCTKKFSKYF